MDVSVIFCNSFHDIIARDKNVIVNDVIECISTIFIIACVACYAWIQFCSTQQKQRLRRSQQMSACVIECWSRVKRRFDGVTTSWLGCRVCWCQLTCVTPHTKKISIVPSRPSPKCGHNFEFAVPEKAKRQKGKKQKSKKN